jgi:protein-tyrosine phosphatase
MPIRDLSVPTPQAMRVILDEMDRSISVDTPVYIHCWGGRGRTGTVVGCYLVRHGLTGMEALKRIRELRGNEPTGHLPSPQTREQEEMVLSWGKSDKKS